MVQPLGLKHNVLFGFLHFNGLCGFCVYKFLVDCISLSCFNIKFVSLSRPCLRSIAMFHVMEFVSISRPCFSIHVFVSSVCFCIEAIFQVKGMFQWIVFKSLLRSILCF
jgi:hypothetical protein